MSRKQDSEDREKMSKEISEVSARHNIAKGRLEELTNMEKARLQSLRLQAAILSRGQSSRRR